MSKRKKEKKNDEKIRLSVARGSRERSEAVSVQRSGENWQRADRLAHAEGVRGQNGADSS